MWCEIQECRTSKTPLIEKDLSGADRAGQAELEQRPSRRHARRAPSKCPKALDELAYSSDDI
jgi:hypothetical protein